MPWKETEPPQKRNYDIALERMCFKEKSRKNKKCADVVAEEVHMQTDRTRVCNQDSTR